MAREDSISQWASDVLEGTSGVLGIHPIFELSHPFNRAARHLFEEFKERSEGIEGLTIVGGPLDANHDLEEVTKILRENPEAQINGILVRLEGKSVWLDEFELGAPGESSDESNGPGVFHGEKAVIHAILELTRRGNIPVRFLSGHGEYDPDNVHPVRGASIFANALRTNGFSVERTDLSDPSALKTDRGVLVIAGARTNLTQPEIESITRYLSAGGRLFLLAEDAATGGLAPLLEKWGIRLDPLENTMSGRSISTCEYGDHPIVSHLGNVRTTYANPCILRPTYDEHSQADTPAATPLAFLRGSTLNGEAESVAMALRQGTGETDPSFGGARLVICGDSGMLSNGMLGNGHDGNTVFLLRTIEWLSGNERPTAAPSEGEALDSSLTPSDTGHSIFRTVCLIFPLSILAFGLILYVPLARKL